MRVGTWLLLAAISTQCRDPDSQADRLTLPYKQSIMFGAHKMPFTLLIYAKSILMFLTAHV